MDEWLRRACSAIIVSDSPPPQFSSSRTSWPSCRRKRDQRTAVIRLPLRSLGPAGVIRLIFKLPLMSSQTVFIHLLDLADAPLGPRPGRFPLTYLTNSRLIGTEGYLPHAEHART